MTDVEVLKEASKGQAGKEKRKEEWKRKGKGKEPAIPQGKDKGKWEP